MYFNLFLLLLILVLVACTMTCEKFGMYTGALPAWISTHSNDNTPLPYCT
jgi:hypothetical protein